MIVGPVGSRGERWTATSPTRQHSFQPEDNLDNFTDSLPTDTIVQSRVVRVDEGTAKQNCKCYSLFVQPCLLLRMDANPCDIVFINITTHIQPLQ